MSQNPRANAIRKRRARKRLAGTNKEIVQRKRSAKYHADVARYYLRVGASQREFSAWYSNLMWERRKLEQP